VFAESPSKQVNSGLLFLSVYTNHKCLAPENYIYASIWVFEIRVQRRIYEPKRDEIIGGCEMFHNQELYSFFSPCIIRMMMSRSMRLTGLLARMGEEECMQSFAVKAEEKRQLGRPRRRWDDNIKMDLR
jgi:hypothetical protein